MGSFRQNVAHSNVQTPLLIVGGLLLLVLLLAIFQQQLRRRKRKQYHPAIELQSSGVLGQIQRRKNDLNRFIGRLRTQLAARERQLQYHDELEDIVTSRVQTARKQDEEWEEIMRAGKKLHGKKWTKAPADDQPSLKELMEMHKDELLQLKATMASGNATGRGRRERRESTRGSAQVMQLPASEAAAAPTTPRVVPPQWQSTRRSAGSLSKPATEAGKVEPIRVDANPWSKNNFETQDSRVPASVVPKLDLARLHDMPTSPSKQQPPSVKPKKSFEETFARQAKLASSLKLKKKS